MGISDQKLLNGEQGLRSELNVNRKITVDSSLTSFLLSVKYLCHLYEWLNLIYFDLIFGDQISVRIFISVMLWDIIFTQRGDSWFTSRNSWPMHQLPPFIAHNDSLRQRGCCVFKHSFNYKRLNNVCSLSSVIHMHGAICLCASIWKQLSASKDHLCISCTASSGFRLDPCSGSHNHP